MSEALVVYVVGSGAVGMALAACLVQEGKRSVAVRTRQADAHRETLKVTLHNGPDRMTVPVETVGISQLTSLDGLVAVTAKSYANAKIATELKRKMTNGPLVIMQNGIGVEKPFVEAGLPEIYRCILYLTSQGTVANEFGFHFIKSSPVGIVKGTEAGLNNAVSALSSAKFPFHVEKNIQREIWKKAIVNAVFNSICPLLETDNGVFVRDPAVAELADGVVKECLLLTDRLGLDLKHGELIEQIMNISKSSDGQLISTLQDIRNGRETEIEYLNLEMARTAAALQPRIELSMTEMLGKLTGLKSKQSMQGKFRET